MQEDILITFDDVEYRFVLTCFACPEQYDVYVKGMQVAYVRLRHGRIYADAPDVGVKRIYLAYPEGDGIFANDVERIFHLTQVAKAIAYETRQEELIKQYTMPD